MAKVLVGKSDDINNEKMTHVTAGGKEILVVSVDGKFYAINNICNHAGAELHEGKLEGTVVTCPWHAAKWDVRTGNLVWFPQKLKPEESHNVFVEDGNVYVEV